MRTLLREPLLHFLVIGLLLFLFYDRLNPADAGRSRIVVGQAQVAALASQYEATWSRKPTAPELAGLVEDHVRDEIAFREGVALGLDRDDPVIKRRIRQKLEVMAEENLADEAPTDAALAAWLQAHPDSFRQAATASFEQVFLGNGLGEAELARRLAAARAALGRGEPPATLGVATRLPRRGVDTPLDQVAREFGRGFASRLEGLALGQWVGPVDSAFGAHLVRVGQRASAVLPPLESVRAQVARDWEAGRRKRALEADYARLRGRYEVVVEGPAAGASRP
jgi:hypothetical protein